MNIALIVVATLLGLAAAVSASGKVKRLPQVVETMHSVGVTDQQMKGLAGLEFLGSLGLLVGIWIPILGVLAALGLTVYFLGAIIAHVRAKQGFAEALPSVGLSVLALATLILELNR